ncbi:uncharacterized protein LOC130974974 isoform X2 [Arachis stenosperma]|uniref:uncharacterized protein LOC130974974 isoform X2 n=1 Tax=Arachis stenosperma TaxID=217475 RepID=UPI0025AD4653|nr:uncharacterized protein LOC130974974 isoform X2 [Arachis stenosperma]
MLLLLTGGAKLLPLLLWDDMAAIKVVVDECSIPNFYGFRLTEWQRGYFLYTEGVSAYNPAMADVLFPACSGPCGGRGVISCTQGYSQQESLTQTEVAG